MTVRYQGPRCIAKWMRIGGFKMFDRIELLEIRNREDFTAKDLARLKSVRRIETLGNVDECKQWFDAIVPKSRLAHLSPINGGMAAVLDH